MQVERWPPDLEDPRAILAKTLDDYNVFDMPQAKGGGSSYLDPREHAIVSLLVGNWPNKSKTAAGLTVAQIIAAEKVNMAHHVRIHGARDAMPEGGIFAKRGPRYRTNTKPKK